MRDGGTGRDRPVHPSDVVADMVGTAFGFFRTGAGYQAQVVTEQQPVQTPGDGQLETPQGAFDRGIRGELPARS